jgi:hypothetical protein
VTRSLLAIPIVLALGAGYLLGHEDTDRTIDRLNTLNDVWGDTAYEFDLCPNVPELDLDGDIGVLIFHCHSYSAVVHYSFAIDRLTLVSRAGGAS